MARIVHGKVNITTNEYTIIADMALDAAALGFSVAERRIFRDNDRDVRVLDGVDGNMHLLVLGDREGSYEGMFKFASITKIESFGSQLAGTTKIDLTDAIKQAYIAATEIDPEDYNIFFTFSNSLVLDGKHVFILKIMRAYYFDKVGMLSVDLSSGEVTLELMDLTEVAPEGLDTSILLTLNGFLDGSVFWSAGYSYNSSNLPTMYELVDGNITRVFRRTARVTNITPDGLFFATDGVYKIVNDTLQYVSENYTHGLEYNSQKLGVYR